MNIEQFHLGSGQDVSAADASRIAEEADLVFAFGGTSVLQQKRYFEGLKSRYPNAIITGCSTAGEICGTHVYDDSLAVTAINFEHTEVKLVTTKVDDSNTCKEKGKELAQQLPQEGLSYVLVISDGLRVNGTDLVNGLKNNLPESVVITGGLSGDGGRFETTLVYANAPAETGSVAVIGFYSDRLKIGYGSLGGWDPFGPDRLITKSKDNVLYELDGQSALELYKKYLGEHADGLPATGLLFPLMIRAENEHEDGLVRTILSVDEEEQSMTFAGDIPEGYHAQLMKANFDRLIDGASGAAQSSFEKIGSETPEFALLISCVGRKLVLKQRIEEEVESVQDVLGKEAVMTGFYSYGEISPYAVTGSCELHNQTMTITTFTEK